MVQLLWFVALSFLAVSLLVLAKKWWWFQVAVLLSLFVLLLLVRVLMSRWFDQ